jgi:hypothetical protein
MSLDSSQQSTLYPKLKITCPAGVRIFCCISHVKESTNMIIGPCNITAVTQEAASLILSSCLAWGDCRLLSWSSWALRSSDLSRSFSWWLSTFRKSQSFTSAWPLKVGPIDCPEKSAHSYQLTPRNKPRTVKKGSFLLSHHLNYNYSRYFRLIRKISKSDY